MKLALPVTLAFGWFSLVIAAVAIFIFYIEWIGRPNLQAITQPPHMAASVASATDLNSLKAACLSLAQSQDAGTAFLQTQAALVERIVFGVTTFSLIWGLVGGVAFFYIHSLLRKLSRKGVVHEL